MLRRKPTDIEISEYPQFIKDYGFEFIHAGDTNTNMLELNFCNYIYMTASTCIYNLCNKTVIIFRSDLEAFSIFLMIS